MDKRQHHPKYPVKKITQARLKEVLEYDSKSGVFLTKDCKRANKKKGSTAGYRHSNGYLFIMIDGVFYFLHRLAWLYSYGYLPELCVDHINRKKTDNRILNLREASYQCNSRNSGNFSHNNSGIRGVVFKKSANKWCARIMVTKKDYHLGYYSEFHNAVCARFAAEQCIGWCDCSLLSPAHRYVNQLLGR